jgi:phage host-nuclease inhibitor protein Gam
MSAGQLVDRELGDELQEQFANAVLHPYTPEPEIIDGYPVGAFLPTECVIIDGYVVTPDGEIVGLADRDETFHVTDLSSAEWVLDKMAGHEAQIAALSMRLAAIQHNITTLVKQQNARRAFLEYRYGQELKAFARQNLKGKSKTWRCAYGLVAFRKTQPGVVVWDEAAAIAWAKEHCPDAVKVKESFLVSVAKDAVFADPQRAQHGLEVTEAGENVKISTGVE